MPRDRWLAALDQYIVHAYVIEVQIVDRDGDVAAVVHRVHMGGTVLGEDRSGTFGLSMSTVCDMPD